MRTRFGCETAFRDNCHSEEETLEWEGRIQIMVELKTNGYVSLTRKAFLAAAFSAVVEYPTCIFPCNIPDKSRLVTKKNKTILYQVKQFNGSWKMRMLWKTPLETGHAIGITNNTGSKENLFSVNKGRTNFEIPGKYPTAVWLTIKWTDNWCYQARESSMLLSKKAWHVSPV